MNNIISVLSPIWVSPDSLEAHFIHYPHAGPQVVPQAEWIFDLFDTLSLKTTPTERTIATLIRNLAESGGKKRNFLLARGTPAVPGSDSYLERSFDAEGMNKQLMKDGTVDVDVLQSSVSVQKGQLLATVVPPSPGEQGINMMGEAMPASAGEHVTFKIDGNVRLSGTTIAVHSVLRINGDVDASRGDIVAGNDIEIPGSVRDGVKVNAAGSVRVMGTVEGGTTISAKGDVIVAKGVQGEGTKSIALGNVETMFVRDG
jgi:uncharacterized protein (DUF342 family)